MDGVNKPSGIVAQAYVQRAQLCEGRPAVTACAQDEACSLVSLIGGRLLFSMRLDRQQAFAQVV